MFKILFLMLVALFGFSVSTNVRKCKNGQPFPLSVNVEGCVEPPCIIVKNTTVIIGVHFLGINDTAEKLTAKVRVTTMGITVPYELPEEVSDVCTNLMYGAMCPIYETEDVVYQLNFYINSIYPEISAVVEISLNNEYNASVACFMCSIKVRKGATTSYLLV